MFTTERMLGLISALGMFVFSAFIYMKTGDWVAAVFVVGSVGYFVFFLLHYKKRER